MADNKVDIKITADGSQASQSLNDVAGGLGKVGQAAGQAAGGAGQAETGLGKMGETAGKAGGAMGLLHGIIGKIALGNLLAGWADAAVAALKRLGEAFIEANLQAERMRGALTAVYGSSDTAERQLGFLRKTARDAGVSVEALGDSFKNFAAATQAANIPLAVSNDLFASVTKAGVALGLSAERTSSVLQALGNMAGKSSISVRDLNMQLGGQLPGALDMAAKGLGITRDQLLKLSDSGGLAARDLFPALADGLKKLHTENDGLQGAWDRTKTAITGVLVAIGDAGGIKIMTLAVKVLGVTLGTIIVPIHAVWEVITGLAKTVGAAAASIAILTDTSTSWAMKAQQLKEVGSALWDDYKQGANRVKETNDAFVSIATGADTAAGGMGRASSAAAELARGWVRVGVAMAEAGAAQEKAAANSAKLAEAAKAEGAAMVLLVGLRGDAAASAQAESAAADRNAQALAAVASARQGQLAILRAELKAKQDLIAGNADEQKARAEELKDLGDRIDKLSAESEAATQSAEAARNEAVAKQAAAEATQDHTGQIVQFTKELAAAQAKVKEYEALQKQGKKTTEEVTEAKRQQALAEARLRDAYSDTTNALKARLTLEAADRQAAINLLQTQKSLAAQNEQLYRLMGDEYMARQAHIDQLEIDVKITNAKAEVARAEAEGSIAVANATLAEMRIRGDINPIKEAELQASIKLAEAKLKEADAIKQSARVTEQAISNLRTYGTEAGRAGERGHDAGRRSAEAFDDAANSIDKATGALGRYGKAAQSASPGSLLGQRDENGFATDAGGKTIGANQQTWLSIYNMVKSMGLDEDQARGIANKAFPNGKYSSQLQKEQMHGKTDSIDVGAAARRAAEEIIRNDNGGQVVRVKDRAKGNQDDKAAPEKPNAGDKHASQSAGARPPANAPDYFASAAAGSGFPGAAPNGGVASVIRVDMGRKSYPIDSSTRSGREQMQAFLRDLDQAGERVA